MTGCKPKRNLTRRFQSGINVRCPACGKGNVRGTGGYIERDGMTIHGMEGNSCKHEWSHRTLRDEEGSVYRQYDILLTASKRRGARRGA